MKAAPLAAFLLTCVLAAPVSSQWVYLNDYPGSCHIDDLMPWWPGEYPRYIYVHAPEVADVTGATFRIESNAMGPEDVITMTPAPGVTIVGGDLFNGLTLSWSPRVMTHEWVLELELSSVDPYQTGGEFGGDVWTRDVTLHSSSGNVDCESAHTGCNMNIDCFWPTALLVAPDTVEVGVGVASQFTFEAGVAYAGGGANFEFDDALSWIITWDPNGVGGACPHCEWHWAHVEVDVYVPPGTSAHTLNPVVLRMMFMDPLREKTIVLRAIEPVETQPMTFSGLKALFLNGND